jgi:signal transduction histidine kinase
MPLRGQDMAFPPQGRFVRAERRFRRVLAGGFLLVLVLMVASGWLAVRSMRQLERGVASMSARYLTRARLEDALERQQAAIGSLALRLNAAVSSRGEPELREVRLQRWAIQRLVEEANRSDLSREEKAVWMAMGGAAENLFVYWERDIAAEGRLAQANRYWDAFLAQAARVLDLAYSDTSRDRAEELARGSAIVRSSMTTLIAAVTLAVGCALLFAGAAFAVFRNMERQAETLSRLSVHTFAEQEETARRFSQEIHDEFGQALTAIASTLSAVEAKTPAQQSYVRDAIGLAKEAQAMARNMSQLLRPRILDDFGLDAALQELAGSFSRRTGIVVDYRGEVAGRLDATVETHLFRIAQEALTNAARHSLATEVDLSLERREDLLCLRVADNGGGLSVEAARGGLGILGMLERARAAGGRLRVQSHPGTGVEVVAEVPFVARTAGELPA